MKIEISRREVLSNLYQFKERLEGKKKDISSFKERAYCVLLNKQTGDMRFSQNMQAVEHRMLKRSRSKEELSQWKEALLIVTKGCHFELKDKEQKELERPLFSDLSWKIIQETTRVLNTMAGLTKSGSKNQLIEELIVRDLSSIHIADYLEEIESLPAWQGKLGREEAEKRLEGQKLGTYLLRDGDELTQSTCFHFAEENHLFVHPFLVTMVDQDEKISDILMVQTSRGWTFYHDDPNLNDPLLYQYRPNPKDLLDELQEIKDPLS